MSCVFGDERGETQMQALTFFAKKCTFSFHASNLLLINQTSDRTSAISRAPRTEHDGVLQHGRAARGGADTHEYCLQPAAVRTDARHTPRRTRTFRARRIRFVSRRVKPHALRHTEQSIWMDQARRHGRALRDTRTPRRWAMVPSNESIPAEGEAIRQAYVPRRCVLPSYSLVYDFSCQSSVC